MKYKLGVIVSIVLLGSLLFLLAAPATAADLSVDDVAKEIICLCGCNSVLINCPHVECAVREDMRATIRSQIAQGNSKAEIVQFFVDQYVDPNGGGPYGEMVLAAPTKRGFNLTAWILPFAALAAGGGVVYFLVKTWVGQGQREVPVSPEVSKEDEAYRRRVEKELKEFGEGR